MKRIRWAPALAGLFVISQAMAISLDNIQLWAGSGTNRAAMVVEWNSPEIFNNTTVPAPVANKTMVWGYRFNGTASGTQMLDAILAADPKLYVMVNESYGTFVVGMGYNLGGNGVIGVTDGSSTNYFVNGLATNNDTTFADSAEPINGGDLYWGGYYGPNWNVWTETNDSGGFFNSPNRGSSPYWNTDTGDQGQWTFAEAGLDDLPVTNGSWIGFSVAAAGYDSNPDDPAYTAFNDDEQAPPSPDGTYVAYVAHSNDFAVQIISSNGLDTAPPYDDPVAVLGPPTPQFVDSSGGDVTDRVSIIDPPYNVTPAGSNVLAVIEAGGQITVNMRRKIHADPHDPYGVDLIVYGNSFFQSLSGISGAVSDGTDLSAATLTSSAIAGHPAIVSVSQDGTNWFTYTNTQPVFPDEAYRWDDTNDSWTDEEMNPTKPLNPFLYTNNFAGQSVAAAIDQFAGASGGTGYSLRNSGLPWIQYVRIQPAPGAEAVIDAIAAADPVVTGDALSIAPDNVAASCTNLFFQRADNCAENQVAIGFDYVGGIARVSAVSLSDLSPFAPVEGDVSSAYQIESVPMGSAGLGYDATVGLRAGDNYHGNGSDLRVFEWNGPNWISQPFTYDATNNEVAVPGVTNFSAFVISRIIPPTLAMETLSNGFAFQLTPVPNCPETIERSTNLETWTPILTFTATNAAPVVIDDSNAPAGDGFYRVQVNL